MDCTWYEQDGLAGLNARFAEQNHSGKEAFFVRMVGPERAGLFLNQPRQNGAFDLKLLDKLSSEEPLSWLNLPAANRTATLIGLEPDQTVIVRRRS